MDRLTSMAVFVRAVGRGGFAAAAEEFGCSATMIGMHVRALEDRLGTRLLNRTTRRQSLTEVGRLYYGRCKQILADIEAADSSADELRSAPRGRLRVTAPVSFGVHALAPAITHYLVAHPEVEIDLVLQDRVVDLVEEEFELAIRIGTLADSTMISHKLAPYRMLVCASPEYLKQHGEPHHPSELSTHNCLGFAYWGSEKEWHFNAAEGACRVSVRGSLRANNGEALKMAARHGLGIIMQPEVLLAEDVRAGHIVPILREFEPPSRPMQIVHLPDRRQTPKIKTFIDFVVNRFRRL